MNWHRKFQITLGVIAEAFITWNILVAVVKIADRIFSVLPSWVAIAMSILLVIGAIVFSCFWQDDSQEEIKQKPPQSTNRRKKNTK